MADLSRHDELGTKHPDRALIALPNGVGIEVLNLRVAAVWQVVEASIPHPVDTHPLGCHRLRLPDWWCFDVMLVRLATRCCWEDAERLCGNKVSDTTVRSRRDEWRKADLFDRLLTEALAAYHRIINLKVGDVSMDGSLHNAPCGGDETGPNPTDRGKLGWKWSILVDEVGIPFGMTTAGANRLGGTTSEALGINNNGIIVSSPWSEVLTVNDKSTGPAS